MKNSYKSYLTKLFAFVVFCFFIFKCFYHFNPSNSLKENLNRATIIHNSIYNDPKHISLNITSMNTHFHVTYVANTTLSQINPNFPTIHITTHEPVTPIFWLQVIRTDCSDPKYKEFIDSWSQGYPFYTKSSEMYDCPAWNYNLFYKPITYWKAHAYAVHIDQIHKKVICLGGIFWGYELPYFALWPKAYKPIALNKQDWLIDAFIFQSVLPEYTLTTLT